MHATNETPDRAATAPGIAALLAAARPCDGGFRVTVPAAWLQGRTAYGGLSAALALHAAKLCDTDLPPLRSALIAFVGPLAGEITVTARRLRRGRNAAYVEASIESDAGLGFRATFVFMRELESRIAHDASPRMDHRPPAPDATLYTGPDDFFTGRFQFLDIGTDAPAEWLRWGRLREPADLDPEMALMAIADSLPPAALKLLGKQLAPLSSLTWIVNLLRPRPETRDGWWLMRSVTDRAHGGYSSQRMTIWNADGVPAAEAMQGVAIFA